MATMNTAIPIYIIRLNDILIYSSLDGSFAKPLLNYKLNPTPTDYTKFSAFFPFLLFDVVVTEGWETWIGLFFWLHFSYLFNFEY